MMKVLWFLALFALTVSAVPIEDGDRVSGENGWYIPQLDGSLLWIDMVDALDEMQRLLLLEKLVPTFTPVTFFLYTKANRNLGQIITATSQSISQSNFNASIPTHFVIHGFNTGVLDPMNKNIREAWLDRGDCNVIFVNWPPSLNYFSQAAIVVPRVGKKVAALINFLASNRGVSFDDVHLVGASLGAHVAGYAGKNTNGQVRTIVGLDPALPCFKYSDPTTRLAKTDAFQVESIQTNGGFLGFLKPIGGSAFYPNGGENQPGCLTILCSHNSSVDYYVDALKNTIFVTIKCENYLDAVDKNCGTTDSSVLMGAVSSTFTTGEFYVPIN